MLDFASNFNALGPPPGIENVVESELERILCSYPSQTDELNHAIGEHLDVPTGCVATGNGSTDILFSLPEFLDHDKTVIFSPTFWEYAAAAAHRGNTIETIELSASNNFETDLDTLEEVLDSQPASVYIANPNNPTSTKTTKDKLTAVVANSESSDFVVDETYLQFDENFGEETLSIEATTMPNLHVVHSFSKFFATPGVRAGALVSDTETVRRYRDAQAPYTTSPLVEAVLPWMLDQRGYIEKSRKEIAEQKRIIPALCRKHFGTHATFTSPEANFMFVDINLPSKELGEHLRGRDIVVREGKEFGPLYDNYFRFVLKSPYDSESLFLAVQEFVNANQ